MGYTVKIKCPKCSLKKELNIGQGMSDCNLDHVISFLSDSDIKLITALQNDGQILSFNFSRYLSICTECHRMDSTPILDLILFSKENMQFKTSCSACEGDVRILKDSFTINELDCPSCLDAKLEISRVGFWD